MRCVTHFRKIPTPKPSVAITHKKYAQEAEIAFQFFTLYNDAWPQYGHWHHTPYVYAHVKLLIILLSLLSPSLILSQSQFPQLSLSPLLYWKSFGVFYLWLLFCRFHNQFVKFWPCSPSTVEEDSHQLPRKQSPVYQLIW